MTPDNEILGEVLNERPLPALRMSADELPKNVITVRVPAMLHAQLAEQAHQARTSLNLLCVSKLMAEVPACPIIPKQHWKKRQFLELREIVLFGEAAGHA